MKKTLLTVMGIVAAFVVEARLVARWDFNNYDPQNPTSTNVLAATVGEAGMPCYNTGRNSYLTTDGTIGAMYVCEANSTDANAVSAFNALGGGNYAIAIPSKSHIALPVPSELLGQSHAFTIKIRCWIPAQGLHAFFNRDNVNGFSNGDADLFITNPNRSGRNNTGIGGDIFGNNNNYKTGIGIGSWQTVTVSAGPTRHDVFLNETTEALYGNNGNNFNFFNNPTEHLTTHNGKQCLLLCADNDGEDGLMYVDYVEIHDLASAYEGKLPHYTKEGLTGEWTFPNNENRLKASVGADAELRTASGSANFAYGNDGVLAGDGYVRAGRYNGIKVAHGLRSNASYTLVMDVRVPNNANKTQTWHSLVWNGSGNDGAVFFKWTGSKYILRTTGDTDIGITYSVGQWCRFALSYTDGGNYIVYLNGAKLRESSKNGTTHYRVSKGGFLYLLLDNGNGGEDYDLDMSYAAVYDRVLSDNEIKELHSRPLAQNLDGSFMTAAAPAGIWRDDGEGHLAPAFGAPLASLADGGYAWERVNAPASGTYVFDLTLPATQTEGGTLVKNASNVASGIYGTGSTYSGSFTTTTAPANFLDNTQIGTWGYWSEDRLDRANAHRLAVVWANDTGLVHYYVDGESWGQIFPKNANTSAKPSTTMQFLNGLGAAVTEMRAYDVALTGDEVAGLGAVGSTPIGNAPTVTITASTVPAETRAMLDQVSFTVSATQADGEKVAFSVDWGDGLGDSAPTLVASGSSQTFTHVYKALGTFTPIFRVISQKGVVGSALGSPIEVVSVQQVAKNVLLTLPWLQNVYTNRFTIMCEGIRDANDPSMWDGLEVQWGENYENRTTMTRVQTAVGNWIYKAHVTVDDMEGETIPYRLGYFGLPLTYDDNEAHAEGSVKLWDSADTGAFKVCIWGDNQQGARDRDWNSDKYAYVRAIFNHMVAQGVDFGVTSGDMASSADYNNQIKPGILQATDGILGKTRPYYVAWGNHDTSYPENMKYFETGSVDEEGYATECNPYHLYRGNVLFIFIPQNCYNATTATWLTNLLATDRARAASFRIMIQHYPFWLECWSGNNNTALLEAAKAGGVDIVFSGHMHGYERYLKDGIVQLTNGGAGYLDHVESVSTYYGDDIFLGGHKNIPYLWARQASPDINNVLGAAEPVRMGCIQSYGELSFENNKLHYRAHGFNADGSYIGVFDDFTLESKTVAGGGGTPPLPSATCADPASYAEFTTKPMTYAKWAAYKYAVNEPYAYDVDKADEPVVNVSKTEIEKFLVWLNGESGDYRLPTVEELKTAFGGQLRREVSEWTRDVDPNTGWCRILGSPAKACEGTWMRDEDKPSIATAGCHADYLGFRLATGAAPAEPVCALDAPLAALAAIAEPGRAYKWENNALVDISEEFYNPTGALVYDVPVILTDAGDVTRESVQPLTFNAGFTAPNATSFCATGPLYVKGEVKAGKTTNQWQWRFGSIGDTLTIDNVTYRGVGVTFRAGDLTLRIKGDNDFSGAMYVFNQDTQHPTNVVTAVEGEPATIRFQSARNLGTNPYRIGENVTMKLSGEYRVVETTALWIDGVLDTEAFNIQGNKDPSISGAGTLKLGYYGSYQNSWPYFGVSNIVITTKRFWRANSPSTKSYNGILLNGPEVHISSTCDWEIPPKDQFGYNTFFLSNNRDFRCKLVFEGEHDVNFAPTYTAGSLSGTGFNNAWDIEHASSGTLTLTTPIKGDIAVTDGFVKVKKMPTTAGTATASGDGKWQIDEALTLNVGQYLTGPVVPGGALMCSFGSTVPAPGIYTFLAEAGLETGDLFTVMDIDSDQVTAKFVYDELGVSVQVSDCAKTAVWTGEGVRSNPLDPNNWEVTASGELVGGVPDANTAIVVSGATAMNVPATDGFVFGELLLDNRVTLTADCDWTAFASVTLRDGLVIDLQGHKLTLGSLIGLTSGKATITDSTTDAEHPGELHIKVPADTETLNDKVVLAGNLKLVKEGEGTFTSSKTGQYYTGGNEIAEGKLKLTATGNMNGVYPIGQNTGSFQNQVKVDSGAVLDIGTGLTAWGYHGITLDGGTVNGRTTQPNFRLNVTSNSVFDAVAVNGDFGSTNLGGISPTLNGNTLDLKIASSKTFYVGSVTGPGTLKLTAGGWMRFIGAISPEDPAARFTLDHSQAINMAAAIDVKDYYSTYNGNYMEGTAKMRVFGTFTPVGNSFYGCEMQDGSTIDLSSRDAAWALTRTNVNANLKGNDTVTFADNATITLAMGDRHFGRWTKVVAWSTAPTNVATLTFQGETKRQKVQVRADGVYIFEPSLIIIIR